MVVTDDSGDLEPLVREIEDERVRYFRNPRRLGMAGNSTEALRRARGSFLGLLHDDDRYLPEFLETLLGRFDADPELGVVFSDALVDDGRPPFRRIAYPVREGRHDHFLPVILECNPILPSLALMRRQTWEEGEASHPLPTDITTADTVLWIRAALLGWPFHFVAEPLVVYSSHEGQLTADEELFRNNHVWLWERFEFDDEETERMRRDVLARALVARAITHLRRDRPEAARTDLARARALSAEGRTSRARLVGALARHPRAVRPVERAWRLARPRPARRTEPSGS